MKTNLGRIMIINSRNLGKQNKRNQHKKINRKIKYKENHGKINNRSRIKQKSKIQLNKRNHLGEIINQLKIKKKNRVGQKRITIGSLSKKNNLNNKKTK